MTGTVTAALGADAVPASVLALSTLTEIGYVDRITLVTDVVATPEQWARAILGDAPDFAERLVWHGLLRLRLRAGRSSTTVAGWRVAGGGDEWLRLEAEGPLLTGNFVVQTAGPQVSLTTLAEYHRRRGRVVWPPLSAVHRRLTPGLLRDAEARLRPH